MTDVRDDPDNSAFSLEVDGETALAGYRREGKTLSFTHTEVPESLEGQGVGSRLIAGALDEVRRRGERIVPLCSFVSHYVDTHPEVRDLVAER